MKRRSVGLIAALLFAWGLCPGVGVVLAATPIISMTFKVDQPIAWPGTPVTFTGVITPVSGGTPTNVGLQMGDHFPSNGTCEPLSMCTVNTTTHDPTWTIPSITAPLTIKYHVASPEARWITYLSITTDGVGCTGACPPQVIMQRPTVTSSVTYSPTGVVMPGDTLHFVVGATANVAGPSSNGPECVTTSAGLGVPTNIQATIPVPSWNPYLGGVCGTVPPFKTTRVVWVAFDCVVTGAIGTDVTVHGANLDGLGDYILVNKTLKIHIGPLPTPSPKPTPKPTPRPTAMATPTSTAGSTGSAPIDSPAAMARASTLPSAMVEPTGPSPDASAVGSIVTQAPTGLETASASPATGPASTEAESPPIVAIVALVLVIGAIALGAFRFRRAR